MKKITGTLVLLVAGGAYAGELDGRKYCRTVTTDGSFGQPPGEAEHCVSFEHDVIIDNKNTLFGNPETRDRYVLVGEKILVVQDGNLISNYRLDKENPKNILIYGSATQLTKFPVDLPPPE